MTEDFNSFLGPFDAKGTKAQVHRSRQLHLELIMQYRSIFQYNTVKYTKAKLAL
jgi:hypothetical protein